MNEGFINNSVPDNTIEVIIGMLQSHMSSLTLVLLQFEPMPKDWTILQEIQESEEIMDTMLDNYFSTEKSYKVLQEGFTKIDETNKSIKMVLTRDLNTLNNPSPSQEINEQMNALAIKTIREGLTLNEEIDKTLSPLKNDRGIITISLLQERDRKVKPPQDGVDPFSNNPVGDPLSAVERNNPMNKSVGDPLSVVERNNEIAMESLEKSAAETAEFIQRAQNPGFFKSMLDKIVYPDHTKNPSLIYMNKPYENKTLEQARKIVIYAVYLIILLYIIYFLSTKTVIVPFFNTFVFWFKRYFVFLAWIIVIGLIYLFMTKWFIWFIREDIRYIAFMLNPVLHPLVHKFWYSKFKKWIKYIVYGIATLIFFLVALFFTGIILFLIMPFFLLLMWASGQLMSYFEKEEMGE